MNQKRAKELRREALLECTVAGIPLETNYQPRVMKQRKLYVNDPYGEPVVDDQGHHIFRLWDSITITMGACMRNVYQKVKKAEKRAAR